MHVQIVDVMMVVQINVFILCPLLRDTTYNGLIAACRSCDFYRQYRFSQRSVIQESRLIFATANLDKLPH